MSTYSARGAALDFEDAHARLHHLVDEADGLEVLRAHQILMVGLDGVARLAVGEQVGATADLHTLAAVGTAVLGHQAHVALARDGHAERTMAEHLDADGLARRTEMGSGPWMAS